MSTTETLFVLERISVRTCCCYGSRWKDAKEKKEITFKFIDDFEKEKFYNNGCIKKFFLLDNKFYCSCFDCLIDTINSFASEDIFKEMINTKIKGMCVLKIKCQEMILKDLCTACLVFVMADNKNFISI